MATPLFCQCYPGSDEPDKVKSIPSSTKDAIQFGVSPYKGEI